MFERAIHIRVGKFRVKLLLCALYVTLVISCDRGAADDTKQAIGISELERSVLAKILKDLPPNKVVVRGSLTEAFGEIKFEFMKEQLPDLHEDTWNDYANKNAVDFVIEKDATVGAGYPVVPLEAIDRDDYRHYLVSRVGFSEDKTQALVYFVDSCDPLCARGAYHLLEKRGETWHIVGESETFRS